jgi:hypothetical protein
MINYTPIAFQSPLYVQPVNSAFAAVQNYFIDGGGGFGVSGLSVADFTTMSGPLIWALQSSNAQALYLQASGTASHTFSINATGVTSSAINLQAGGTSLTSLLRVVQTSASAAFPSVLLNNTNSSSLVRGILLSGAGITAESTGTTPLTVPIVDAEGYIRLPVVSSLPTGPSTGAACVNNSGLRIWSGGAWSPGNVDNVTLTKNIGITIKTNGITPRKQTGAAFFALAGGNFGSYYLANTTMATISFTGTSSRYAMVGLCSTDTGDGIIVTNSVPNNTTAVMVATFTVNGTDRATTIPVTLSVAANATFPASGFMRIVPVIAGSNTVSVKLNVDATVYGAQLYAVLL